VGPQRIGTGNQAKSRGQSIRSQWALESGFKADYGRAEYGSRVGNQCVGAHTGKRRTRCHVGKGEA